MLHTALHAAHADAGATFTGFAGYEMPVHYGSIKEEHMAVREAVGLFDVSHMSNLWITGPDAGRAIGAVTTKDPHGVEVGKGAYTVLVRDDGTILDDTFYFRLGEERWLMIPNAGQNQAAADHVRQHTSGGHEVADETLDWSILALQGPKAREVLAAASDDTGPKFHRMVEMAIAGADCLVSGSGYTGEKGVEIYVRNDGARTVWDHLMQVGSEAGIRPIGLGARDTLRLEKGYCLAGNEFAGGRTPLEARLGWLIDWDHDFLGKAALIAQKEAGGYPVLTGLEQAKGIPRAGYKVLRDGVEVGVVTSGTQSPCLQTGIALAYVHDPEPGETLHVDVRGRPQEATVRAPPFL